MKIRNLLLTVALLGTATTAMADQRTEQEARQLAAQYLQRRDVAPHLQRISEKDFRLVGNNALRRVATRGKNTASKPIPALETPYYVYNFPQGGYIIVSGTTNLDPVIAYGETGSLDPDADNLPDGLRYWLGYAAEAAAYAEVHPEAKAPHPSKARRLGVTPDIKLAEGIDYDKDIAPLLENGPKGNIKWGQDAPYNNDAPVKNNRHCYTGCMATAMAQVMAYHQFPSEFNWDLILPSYKGGRGNADQKAEVAKLNRAVGDALQMEYGTDQSGSVSTMYARALRERFGFHKNVSLITRDNFTYGDWMDIILSELMQKRPVIYDGVSNSGGHAFVIDGYRASDGFVHVNWGWEGMSDDYYNIILLDPKETGIGATLSSGFTTYQDAVVGVEPDGNKDVNYYLPIQGYGMQGELVPGTGDASDGRGYLSMQYMANLAPTQFSGEYGALFLDSEGKEAARVKIGTVSAAASTMNSNPHATFSGSYFDIPALQDGVYRVYCYMKEGSSDRWAIAHPAIDKPNFMTYTQMGGEKRFDFAAHHPTDIKASNWSFETAEPKYGDTGLTVTLTNTGNQLEYGSYAVIVDVPNQLSRNFYNEFHRLRPGQSETLTIPVTFNEYGEYVIRSFKLERLNGGGSADVVEPQTIKFSVNRSLPELITLLNTKLFEYQDILDKAKLSGNYPEEACTAFQGAINDAKAVDQSGLTVESANALLAQLESALSTFYKSLSGGKKNYWGYVNGNASQIDQSWTPGGTQPLYCGISVDESDLSAYVGGQIIGLRCLFGRKTQWINWAEGDLEAKVFLLNYDGVYPGSTILAQGDMVTVTKFGDYEEYLFDKPYTIGAEGVFCVAEIITPNGGGYYGAMGAAQSIYGDGKCWLNVGSGWEDMYGTYGQAAYGHAIQAIIVGGGNVVDGKLTNVSANSVAVNQDIVINGKFQNLSSDPVNEFELLWAHDDDGQGGKTKVTKKVDAGATVDFSLTIPGFATAKLHNIRLSVSTLGGQPDMIAANSTVDIKVPVTANTYTRNIVLEESTGTWCGFCPRGIVTFEKMKEEYGDRFIGVSLHTGDELEYTGNNYTPLTSLYLSQQPSGLINRKPSCYTSMEYDDVKDIFEKESKQCIAMVEAEAFYDPSSNEVHVATETEFGYDFNGGDYRLTYLVIEDQAGKYAQENYYAGGSRGAMGGWEGKPGKVLWTYDDVLREQLPAFDGKVGSIPTSLVGGTKSKYLYSFALPANVKDVKNVRIAVLILDPTSVPAEVVNAVQVKVKEGAPEGLNAVELNSDPEAMYDLQGRRINRAQDIFVKGGQKYMTK